MGLVFLFIHLAYSKLQHYDSIISTTYYEGHYESSYANFLPLQLSNNGSIFFHRKRVLLLVD